MDEWIADILHYIDRQTKPILFGEHAAKDKNLTVHDVNITIQTVKYGKVENKKSTESAQRICFKRYHKQSNLTYLVITECTSDLIKVITVIKKRGKY